jgi:hypothetical protein
VDGGEVCGSGWRWCRWSDLHGEDVVVGAEEALAHVAMGDGCDRGGAAGAVGATLVALRLRVIRAAGSAPKTPAHVRVSKMSILETEKGTTAGIRDLSTNLKEGSSVTVKLHLTLFHGSRAKRRVDDADPAISISAASAAQALENFEFDRVPFVPKPGAAASRVLTRNSARAVQRVAPPPARRPAPRRPATVHHA